MKLTIRKSFRETATWSLLSWTSAAVAMLLVVLFASLQVFAWGPERPTFTGENPADYVTFNAITNNPNHGDERNFVLIREAGTGTYVDEIQLEVGKEYEVYSYFHNNAKDSLNASGVGIAQDVRMSAQVPSIVQPGERGTISTTISSSNANPTRVWDEVYVTTDSAVALRYVPASARIHSNGAVNGSVVPSSLFTDGGTYLGYNELNGILPGCAQYAGYVIYRLAVDQPGFDVSKEVSVQGQASWVESVEASTDGTVDFRVSYRNTGTTDQNDVTIQDVLPAGLTYVAGSTVLTNNENPDGVQVSDNITTNGINIGNYGSGASATVTFSARVNGSDLSCGDVTLTNSASVATANGTKSDTAQVVVSVECAPDECKPGVPKGDERCDEAVPAALPTTGPAEIIAAVMGVTLVSLGFAYWLRSRKAYQHALAGFTEDMTELPEEKLLTARTETKPKDDHASYDFFSHLK